MADLGQSGVWIDDLYAFFVVAMQRTGNTKEALRQTILRGQPGLTAPEGGHASQNAEAALPVIRAEHRRYREALVKINDMGAVCADFMECDHRSCRDSCGAKLTALAALEGGDDA